MSAIANLIAISKRFLKTAKQDGWPVGDLTKAIQDAETELAAKDAKIAELFTSDSQAVDEFNAGYEAYKAGLDLDDAEQMYRHALPDEVPSYDQFGIGYAWAKFQAEKAATK